MSSATTKETSPQQVSTTFFSQPSIERASFPGSFTTTFTATTPWGFAPFTRVLSQFDPALGHDFEALQNELQATDAPVPTWLAASEENRERFAEDPLRALRESDCGVSPNLLVPALKANGPCYSAEG